MKKTLLLTLILLLSFALFAEGCKPVVRDDLFKSDEELAAFQTTPCTEEEKEFYSSMQISLITGGPGSMVWENFGHAAIMVSAPGQTRISFDYGIFTFDDSFYGNFILGKLYYNVYATIADYRIWDLEDDDRSVYITPLNLTADQKKAAYQFLMYNTEDENNTYLYDYFGDNCATRLRDIYSWAQGGDFENTLKATPSSETTREYVVRYLKRSTFFVDWTINFLLGPGADKKISMWEACFLPDVLMEKTEEYQGTKSEEVYLTQNRAPVDESYSLIPGSILLGLVLGALAILGARGRMLHRPADFLLGLSYLYLFICSSVLLFMMGFTIHTVTYGNMVPLIVSPLTLALSILHFASLGRKRKESKILLFSGLSLALATATVLVRAVFASLLIQDIWPVAIPALLLYGAEFFANHSRH